MPKVGELIWMSDSDIRSESAGRTAVIRALTGKARWLYELATGESPDGEHVTPRNPQDGHGVDLSGPPWGSALRHPIAWSGGLTTNANVQGVRQALTVNTEAWEGIVAWQVYNRQFEQLPSPSVAPYARAAVTFRAHLSSAGTRTLSLAYRSNGSDARGQLSETFSVTSTTEASFESTKYVPLVPGLNEVTILAKVDDNATNHVVISSIVLNQIKKRSW